MTEAFFFLVMCSNDLRQRTVYMCVISLGVVGRPHTCDFFRVYDLTQAIISENARIVHVSMHRQGPVLRDTRIKSSTLLK